ncbi:hypothetical protein RMN56_29705 [Micromonospora halotolerans]|uniref:Uncharacterized protein n=1 Tax=Micromonospora halotolerans TaxID=709879 RepID=A0ABY9ZVM1_9ACTN|nr:hypothetical protein [Micromonospora halotolerans]WNM39245.1 hypothetical protein RMN56_29705 [Micromonospora halotolerans]
MVVSDFCSDGRPTNRTATIATSAISVNVVLFGLAIAGATNRGTYQLAQHYGTEVAVTLGESCWENSNVRSKVYNATCDGVTWFIDGETVPGKLLVGPGEVRDSERTASMTDESITAYAYGNEAYTEAYTDDRSPLYPLGLVPRAPAKSDH